MVNKNCMRTCMLSNCSMRWRTVTAVLCTTVIVSGVACVR